MAETLRDRIPLQRRKILKKSLGSMIKILAASIVLSALFLGLVFGEQIFTPSIWNGDQWSLILGWLVLVLLLAFNKMIYEWFYFLTYFYDMDEKNVIIRKGVITKREITLPFSKITDVNVDQDLFDVFLGLYDLHISTPTVDSGVFAHIDGLNKKGSTTLRKLILDKING